MILKVEKEIKDCGQCPFYNWTNSVSGGRPGLKCFCTESKASFYIDYIDGELSVPWESQIYLLQMRCPHINWIPELQSKAGE